MNPRESKAGRRSKLGGLPAALRKKLKGAVPRETPADATEITAAGETGHESEVRQK